MGEKTSTKGRLHKFGSWLKAAFLNITIEPAMFMTAFAWSVDNIAIEELTIYKSCRNDFGYNKTVCENLLEDYPEENKKVQDTVAQFAVYGKILNAGLPVFLSFYYGAWADMFGRKMLFYLFLISKIFAQAATVIWAFFEESPKEWALIIDMPVTLMGGYATWRLAVNAFIADIAKPEDRAFRLQVVNAFVILARPLSAPAGAYLWRTGGFACVTSAGLLIIIVTAIYVWLRMRNVHLKLPEVKKQRGAFSLNHIKDCIYTTVRRRPGPNRKFIMVLLLISVIRNARNVSERPLTYNYVRTMFGWKVDEYSTYNSIDNTVTIVALVLSLLVFTKVRLNESRFLTALFFIGSLKPLLQGIASEPWLFYIGGFFDMFGSYDYSITRSMMSVCVGGNEIGKIYATLEALEDLVPIGVLQAYASLWKLTGATVPGAIFYLSFGLTVVIMGLALYVQLKLKGRPMSEVASKEDDITENKQDPVQLINVAAISYI